MLAHIQPTAASTNSTSSGSVLSALPETAFSGPASTVAMSNTREQASEVPDVEQSITVDSDLESVDIGYMKRAVPVETDEIDSSTETKNLMENSKKDVRSRNRDITKRIRHV